MPLRPDFHYWLDILTEYKYHEEMRRQFPIRANDGFNLTSRDQWKSISERLSERLEDFPRELEAIQGTLRALSKKRVDFEKIGEIIFIKGNRPFYILENTNMFSIYRTVCCVIDIEKLVKHGCISYQDLEKKKIEAGRWGIIKSAGIYVILCAALIALGDLRNTSL